MSARSSLKQAVFFERAFVVLVILTFALFAYFVTTSQVEAIEADHVRERATRLRSVARDVSSLLERKQSLSARLSNVLGDGELVFAVVQRARDGVVEARGEGGATAMPQIRDHEKQALSVTGLTWIPFMDPSGTGEPLVEGILPLMVGGERYVVRLGYQRDREEREIRGVVFRNLLLFTIVLLIFVFYWLVKHRDLFSLRVVWIGATAILVLLAFVGTTLLVRTWFSRLWSRQFKRMAISVGQRLAPTAQRYFEHEREEERRVLDESAMLGDEGITYVAIARQDRFFYHSVRSEIGQKIDNERYKASLGFDSVQVMPVPDDPQAFEVYAPVMLNQARVATLLIGMRAHAWSAALTRLQGQLVVLFIGVLAVALYLIHLVSRRLSRDVGILIQSMEAVTAGDLRQNVYLDRHDEIGTLAQTYNFMMLGLRERDLLGKGLQQYVSRSIVNQTLKVIANQDSVGQKQFVVTLFAPFHGLDDALNRERPPELFAAIREVVELVRKVAADLGASKVQTGLGGLTVIFGGKHKHDELLLALRCADLLLARLRDLTSLPFEVPLVIHCFETLFGHLDHDSGTFWGEIEFDVVALAKVQDKDEVFLSEAAAFLLREVAEMQPVEVEVGRGIRIQAFAFRSFKSLADLAAAFPNQAPQVKLLNLKVMRQQPDPSLAGRLIEWYGTAEPTVRFGILEVLEKSPPPDLMTFLEGLLTTETDPRTLSKVIQLLGRFGNEKHVPLLAEKLRTGDRRVKANTVEALEKIGGSRVYEFFNLLLDETDNRVKANILISLGKYGDLKVFDLLTRMMNDSDKNMRASAAYALGQLGMAQGVEPLIAALSDKDPDVRRQVVASLSRLRADLEIDL